MAKVKKTFRLDDKIILELEKLSKEKNLSQTDVLQSAIQNVWHETNESHTPNVAYELLKNELEIKNKQIADLSTALLAAQDTAKAAQALQAASVQQAALESADHVDRRRWRWPWSKENE